MKKYEARLRRLEERKPSDVTMIALRYSDGTLYWNNEVFPDEAALIVALEKMGLQDERFIILPHYGKRP